VPPRKRDTDRQTVRQSARGGEKYRQSEQVCVREREKEGGGDRNRNILSYACVLIGERERERESKKGYE
jgi:hypothetical protein